MIENEMRFQELKQATSVKDDSGSMHFLVEVKSSLSGPSKKM